MSSHNRLPFVTVIMPVRNEGDFIARSLEAVLTQDYPHDCFEVLIADGMSTDNTRDRIAALAQQYRDIPLRVIDNPGKIVPTGLNAAITQARGAIIVRVDGHTIISRDYLSNCVKVLESSEADTVGGRMTPVSHTLVGTAIALATSSPFGVGGARFHYSNQEEWVDTVYMGAWHRSIFSRVGLFDEEFVRNQDDEFNYRLRSKGGKILLSPNIRSEYYNRTSLKTLFRQYYQYGLYKVRVLQKHPRQMRLRQFVPPLFVATLIGAVGLVLLLPKGWVVLAGVAGSYLAANLAASAWTARKGGWPFLLLLPLVFATLHLSYGIGFLVGFVKFWNRWGERQPRYRSESLYEHDGH